MTTDDEKHTDAILLIEYQKAQDSAEHHDKLIWTVSSIFFAGIIALLGFLAKDFSTIKDEPITLMISIFGIMMAISLGIIIQSFKFYKNSSYLRCRQIERNLGMNHHLSKGDDEGLETKETPVKQSWIMWTLLSGISIIFLILILNYFEIIQI